MYSNEQVSQYITILMKELQAHLNNMEMQCVSDEPDVKVISLEVGKCMKIYSLVSHFMGIYDGIDKTKGGFRESVWALKKMEGEDVDLDDIPEE